MPFPLWFTVAGVVLVAMALAQTVLERLPLTTGLVYLVIGVLVGPLGIGLLDFDPVDSATVLEHLTEVSVIISLFAAGLKLREPQHRGRAGYWSTPVRLATLSMILSVGFVAAVGVWGLGLGIGAAILLGAIMAPTDPVLANEVSVEHVRDRDRLRFALTGEAGLNDGTAFPFVMLGLVLMGIHEMGESLTRWLLVDVVWATAGGLAIGAVLGWAVGRLVLYLRKHHKEAISTDDLLTLGLIGLAYGAAVHAHAYGFLAVFAAGVALRRTAHSAHLATGAADGLSEAEAEAKAEEEPGTIEVSLTNPQESLDEASADPKVAPNLLIVSSLHFTEQLERIGEVALVLVVGAALFTQPLYIQAFWFIPLLLLVLRPLAVYLGLIGAPVSGQQKAMAAWFGVRGIGSLYYLAYAIGHELPEPLQHPMMSLVLWTIAVSIVVHGISVTPLMNWYERRQGGAAA